MLSPRFLSISARIVRVVVGVCGVLFALAGYSPTLADWLRLGAAVIEWLKSPVVYIPLIMISSVLLWHDILLWRIRRRMRRHEAMTVTLDMPIREAFKYLRFESEWATQFRDRTECALRARDVLEDNFCAGQLNVWGRNAAFSKSSIELISDHRFWTGTTLSGQSLSDFAENSDTLPSMHHGQLTRFIDLHVSRQQVERAWPRATPMTKWVLARRMMHPEYDTSYREPKWRKSVLYNARVFNVAARRIRRKFLRLPKRPQS